MIACINLIAIVFILAFCKFIVFMTLLCCEKYMKSEGIKRHKYFINGSKIIEGVSGVKKDVRWSWEVSAEKFVKSRFGDREKGRRFNERNDFSERNRKLYVLVDRMI